MNFSAKPVMQPEEFRLIREFVAEEFGLLIDEARLPFFSSKLLPRLEELQLESFSDYYASLKFSPRGCREHQQLVSIITNNETYFFREDAQLQILAGHLLPELKEKKQHAGMKKIRVYSAGCSSGEEVYTLAMILLESGHFLWDWDIMVTGIDIDPVMIAKAREGVYCGRAFQTTPPQYLDRYFSKQGDCYRVKDSLRKVTNFVEGNLLRLDPFLRSDPADVIFCRNVFIYFSDETTRGIVESFAGLLEPEGYLFLGHSESLSRITSRFLPVRHPGAIIYRKRV
jgi:chemotaxis protein methyltransferase CheR